MASCHEIRPERANLHGVFSRELPPVLTIEPGDTVVFQTLDTGWGRHGESLGIAGPSFTRDPERDAGHALCGPIAVRGAEPGDVLEVQIGAIVPGTWGWTAASPRFPRSAGLGIERDLTVLWQIDRVSGTAHDANGIGMAVPLSPFMGILGNAPAAPGMHSTNPPRSVGGNLDCRELVTGSTLWLPVAVPGALFSTGDGHAAQGDGEVCQTAIECPMERVELTFTLRKDLAFTMPRAATPAGYLTLGLGETLDAAVTSALDGMLDYLHARYHLSRAEAHVAASVAVHLRVTQIVNGTVGVHALLPDGALDVTPQ